jgi:hypothetical protein
MQKSEAIKLFGSVKALSEALGVTRQAFYKCQNELPQGMADRINGAALRLGLIKVSDDDQRAA